MEEGALNGLKDSETKPGSEDGRSRVEWEESTVSASKYDIKFED
jgi:hypothetical protein